MAEDQRPAELRRIEAELWLVYGRTVPDDWAFGLGPIKLRRSIRSLRATQIYVLFNAALFVVGIVLTLSDSGAKELGVAIVVGALFSFGSFVAQFWAVLIQREYEHRRAVFGADFAEQVAAIRRFFQRCGNEAMGATACRQIGQ